MSFIGVKFFNELPTNVKNETNFNTIKKLMNEIIKLKFRSEDNMKFIYVK